MPERVAMVTKIFPIFAVRDLDEALRYYCDVLGFTESWKWGDPPHRAGIKLDEIEIQLDAAGLGGPPGASVVYCHMTGVDEYYDACRRRGAKIPQELADRPWGARDFRVLDPSGNRLGFAELLAT
jgi:uncharacterized glyoxalase superfamily protein PhnB